MEEIERKMFFRNIPGFLRFFLFAVLCFAAACSSQDPRSYTNRTYGFSFELPRGWRHLTPREREEKFPGTIMAAEDEKEKAVLIAVEENISLKELEAVDFFADFSILAVPESEAGRALSEETKKNAARLALMVYSMAEAVPSRYSDSRIIKKGLELVDDKLVGELVFTGSEKGDEPRWRRIWLIPHPRIPSRLLLLGISTPLDQKDEYSEDMVDITFTWEWRY